MASMSEKEFQKLYENSPPNIRAQIDQAEHGSEDDEEEILSDYLAEKSVQQRHVFIPQSKVGTGNPFVVALWYVFSWTLKSLGFILRIIGAAILGAGDLIEEVGVAFQQEGQREAQKGKPHE